MYAGYQAMILIRNVGMLQSSSSKIEIYTILLHSPTKDSKYFDVSSTIVRATLWTFICHSVV